ncbi:MAG: radical SAM protein [Firmicutes bacterium]|nr:radical SAM protein [Bacillota bacterium]
MYHLLYADPEGSLFEHPSLAAAGRTGDYIVDLEDNDLVELPAGASLVMVPGRPPLGLDRKGRFAVLEHAPASAPPGRLPPRRGREGRFRETGGAGEKGRGSAPAPVYAVGALLPQGYTRTLLPACRREKDGPPLPLFGYTAVAARGGKIYAAARRTEDPGPWDPVHYNTEQLPQLVRRKLRAHPGNRIVRQLARCAVDYRCFTAQNIFYGRREGGIPVSPSCNAACLGCISLQPSGCCPAPQARIGFCPEAREVAELAVPHLSGEDGAIVSFGQGCEGEPALAAGTVAGAIGLIRAATGRGTVNMNTNGGHTAGVSKIVAAGLDSVRVSLISARPEVYAAYYRPRGYGLDDVRRTIRLCAGAGVHTSLNLLVMPGLTDRAEEAAALVSLIREDGVHMVQLRNLNIDPDFLFERLPPRKGGLIGIDGLIDALREVPGLRVGSYTKPVR